MNHIVHVSNDFEPVTGGINTHLKNLLRCFGRDEFEITLLVPTPCSERTSLMPGCVMDESGPFRIVRSFHQRSGFKPGKLRHITKETKEGLRWISKNVKKIDLIHQHDKRATRIGATRFASGHNIPIIWTNHSPDYFGRNGFFMRMLLKFLRLKPEGLIAVHRSMALLLNESQFKDIPVRYIPNGVNPEDFTKTNEHSEKKTVVLFPQRLVPMKGPEILAEAAVEILSSHDDMDISFWFAGSEPSSNRDKSTIERIRELLTSYCDENRVKYLGNPSYEQMPAYYSQADIVVLPLQVETENISVFEAWASGTPLITTRHVETNGYMNHKENCLVVPDKDPGKLAEAIVRLSNDVELRERLAENGREIAEDRFTWTHAAEKTAEFYREILTNRRV